MELTHIAKTFTITLTEQEMREILGDLSRLADEYKPHEASQKFIDMFSCNCPEQTGDWICPIHGHCA